MNKNKKEDVLIFAAGWSLNTVNEI